MTFTEAAVEILRLVGRPLHYKKITELAIERNLLSHVGKAPEMTMSSRLATMVKKDRGDEPIVKVKPGVFALREFTEEMLALADSDEEIDLSALTIEITTAQVELVLDESGDEVESSDAPSVPISEPAPKRGLPGSEVFPEEEDDDEPILANLDDEEEKDDERGDSRSRRRRRRRRRGRNDEDGLDERAAPEEQPRPTREREREREPRDRFSRERGAKAPSPVDLNREPDADDVVGQDLADAIHSILGVLEPGALAYAEIADHLVRRGRLMGDPAALAPTVAAAVRADSRRRERPRFRYVEGRVALIEWYLPREAVRQEREATRLAERQREQMRRAFLKKIQELPAAGFVELVATWLNAEGVSSLRAVRRPGSSAVEVHLAGVLRRGGEEVRIALTVLRDGRELTRERVVEMRGSLHHYGSASAAWIISTGSMTRGAREEATVPGVSPVALYDGSLLCESMEARRIGLVPVTLPLWTLDLELLDSLRGGPEAIGREARDEWRRDSRNRRDERVERVEEPREPREETREREVDDARPAERARAEAEGGAAEGERGRRRRRRRRGRGGADEVAPALGAESQPDTDASEPGDEGARAQWERAGEAAGLTDDEGQEEASLLERANVHRGYGGSDDDVGREADAKTFGYEESDDEDEDEEYRERDADDERYEERDFESEDDDGDLDDSEDTDYARAHDEYDETNEDDPDEESDSDDDDEYAADEDEAERYPAHRVSFEDEDEDESDERYPPAAYESDDDDDDADDERSDDDEEGR